MPILNILGGLIWAVICIGLLLRHRQKLHIPIMLGAFVADVGLVLYIELTRHAIEKASQPATTMLLIHVILSVVTVLLYLVQIGTGYRLWKKKKGRSLHRLTGYLFLIFRTGNFLTSWLV